MTMTKKRRPIAVFYHCIFGIGARTVSSIEPTRPPLERGPLPAAESIVRSQMQALTESGLLEAADRIYIGVNGGPESFALAEKLFPPKAIVNFHGLDCRNELRTMLMLERFVEEIGRYSQDDWSVCYHHSKGASHPVGDVHNTKWRRCMEKHVIRDWRACVAALDAGHEAAGAHFLSPPSTPGDQKYFAGTFFWARSRYLHTIPSLLERERIYESGIDALESRFEAEVYIGNAHRAPRVLDFHPRLDSFDGCAAVKPLAIG